MAISVDAYFPVRVTTIAERDSQPHVEGLRCFVSDTLSEYVYHSGSWVLVINAITPETQVALDAKVSFVNGPSIITVSTTAPVSPAVNDVWIDIS